MFSHGYDYVNVVCFSQSKPLCRTVVKNPLICKYTESEILGDFLGYVYTRGCFSGFINVSRFICFISDILQAFILKTYSNSNCLLTSIYPGCSSNDNDGGNESVSKTITARALFLVHFFAVPTSTTWNFLMRRRFEEASTRRRIFLSQSKLERGPQEFNSRELPFEVSRNKCENVWEKREFNNVYIPPPLSLLKHPIFMNSSILVLLQTGMIEGGKVGAGVFWESCKRTSRKTLDTPNTRTNLHVAANCPRVYIWESTYSWNIQPIYQKKSRFAWTGAASLGNDDVSIVHAHK